MERKCALTGEMFEVSERELAFMKKMVFQFGDVKVEFPLPIYSPNVRQQIRTAHRNEQYLFKRKSDFSGQEMISIYPQKAPWGEDYKVYSPDEWNGDGWGAGDYGRDFDFSRPFFEQFAELQKAVPRLGLVAISNENSPYVTGTAYSKNCHLINSSEYCEDCYYGKLLQKCRSSVDCDYLYDSELCYQCFSVYNSYGCGYLSFSQNCNDCWFSENLNGCKDCFLCTNLTRKQYFFMNRQLSKEEYGAKVAEYMGSYVRFQEALQDFERIKKERIRKYANIVNSENCSGDFIENSKNCVECYDVNDSEDCRYLRVGVEARDCFHCSNMYVGPELGYDFLGSIGTYHVAYCCYIFRSRDVLYSEYVYDSHDMFGCVGMKNQQFCVLNKQYSEAAYNELVPKIIEHMKSTGEWGVFFPPKYSPHAYNESLANDYFPLSSEEVLARGWNWNDELDDSGSSAGAGDVYEVPDRISEVGDEIVGKTLVCGKSGKLYRIMPQELNFYRRMKVPVPQISPAIRHEERMAWRQPMKTYDRKCDKCGAVMKSVYPQVSDAMVYCEECFRAEM